MKRQYCDSLLRDLIGVIVAWILLMGSVVGCIGSDTAAGGEKVDRTFREKPANAEALDAVHVQTTKVVTATFEGRVSLTGLARPRRVATVASEVPGRLVKNRCSIGRRVKKNELIYRVDTAGIRLQLRQATETVEARRTDAKFSARELVRAEELVQGEVQPEQALTKSRYDRDRSHHGVKAAETALSLARKALRDAVVRAPFSGTIAQCLVEKGDYVRPGTPVFRIVDLSEVRLEAGVPAALATGLRLNTRVKAEFEALGATRDALLIETAPSPNPASGTYPVRFAVRNQDGAVLEGMTARISLAGEPREALTVPREAVFRIDGEPRVFTVSDARALASAVRLGVVEDGKFEITSGLKEGDLVVVDGMFALTDGRSVMVEQRSEEE